MPPKKDAKPNGGTLPDGALKSNAGDEPPDFTKDLPRFKEQAAKEAEAEKPKRRAPTRKPALEKQIEDLFLGLSLAIMATGDEYCSNVLATQAAPLARAWGDLAKVNPRVEEMLEKIMGGSAWGAVILTTAATVMPIAAHHGLWPESLPLPFSFGIAPPPSSEVGKHERKADETKPSSE